jgi:hypothetical protein
MEIFWDVDDDDTEEDAEEDTEEDIEEDTEEDDGLEHEDDMLGTWGDNAYNHHPRGSYYMEYIRHIIRYQDRYYETQERDLWLEELEFQSDDDELRPVSLLGRTSRDEMKTRTAMFDFYIFMLDEERNGIKDRDFMEKQWCEARVELSETDHYLMYALNRAVGDVVEVRFTRNTIREMVSYHGDSVPIWTSKPATITRWIDYEVSRRLSIHEKMERCAAVNRLRVLPDELVREVSSYIVTPYCTERKSRMAYLRERQSWERNMHKEKKEVKDKYRFLYACAFRLLEDNRFAAQHLCLYFE